jgi:hypothetical protein
MIVSDIIHFENIGTNAPGLPCNICGQASTTAKMATIYPFTDTTSETSFVVCSDKCEKAFMEHPKINVYILGIVNKAAEYGRLDLNQEYIDYEQEFLDEVKNQALNN